jgi:ABC-2 type transport system ATP-binding protein
VRPGEVVGLLGSNGAGKSTTLRILSCFLPATSGTVRIDGRDLFSESEEVRRTIGYMPENNPLHTDMRVRDYLKFRARLKGLSAARSRERTDDVLERCALTDVSQRYIGHLSKGYRQRVGLADALVHDPRLIILDEPTIGLDPHQMRSVRSLIKSLAGNHTVVISTHILPEVEMTCTRVLIMYEGRVLADDTTENLQRGDGSTPVVAEVAAPREALEACWNEAAEVDDFEIMPLDGSYHRCSLTPTRGADLRTFVYAQAMANGWRLRELTRTRHTLEDIYVRVTHNGDET